MKIIASPKIAQRAQIRFLQSRNLIKPSKINNFQSGPDPAMAGYPKVRTLRRVSALVCLLLVASVAFGYELTFSPSPDEALGKVEDYVGVWRYTNSTYSNSWNSFGIVFPGTTNIVITPAVPSPAYLAVRTVGTNFILTTPTNVILYNTNTLATIFTNVPVPPASPSTPALSQ